MIVFAQRGLRFAPVFVRPIGNEEGPLLAIDLDEADENSGRELRIVIEIEFLETAKSRRFGDLILTTGGFFVMRLVTAVHVAQGSRRGEKRQS